MATILVGVELPPSGRGEAALRPRRPLLRPPRRRQRAVERRRVYQGTDMTGQRDVLTRAYAAFNASDIDAVLAAMHPDVDWPNGWEGGRVRGQGQVRDYWTRQEAGIDAAVEPVGFSTDREGRMVVSVHQVVRDLDGRLLSDGMVAHVYRIEDGLIRSMEIRTV